MKLFLFVILFAGIAMIAEGRTRFVRQIDRDLFDCISRCLTTNEYNPVCGSDGNTYNNMAKLECAANQCNRNVQFVRRGACQ